MEFLFLYLLITMYPLLINQFLMRNHKTMGLLVIGLLIFLSVLFFNMIRALRTCGKKSDSWGFLSGIQLGVITSIVSILTYIGLTHVESKYMPLLQEHLKGLSCVDIPTEIPIGIATDLIKGLCISTSGFLGFWLGRIFIDICED